MKRKKAIRRLNAIDAEIARLLVYDGSLSEKPLDVRNLSGWRRDLRERRLVAVADLEAVGGRDPWPVVLVEPTETQRYAFSGAARVRHGDTDA